MDPSRGEEQGGDPVRGAASLDARPAARFPDEPAWPASNGARVVFLLDASSRLERELLEDWIARHRPAGSLATICDHVAIAPSRRRRRRVKQDGRLEACLAGDDDPLLAPLRVAWERERSGGRESPLRELLTLGDPRDPGALRQGWILNRHPDRCRIVAGEPAHVSELRERWRKLGATDASVTSGLPDFVARQAALSLERAERRIRGQRYKVPKLVREDILSRPAFRAGIARLARELGEPEESVARRAERYLREMAATHSPFLIELSAQLIHVLYTQGYEEGLQYDRARLEEIYNLGQRHPVIFLPSHKSNLDHLVLQYALHENGHPPNHTAGGINMNFFPVGPLMRRTGVFFIRRTFKDNPVYKFVIRQYVDYLIEKRFSLEWYIEGGRSRSGKLLPPRFGLLAYVVDAYRRAKAEDVYLIPVSIAYDQIQDVGDYVSEQRGGKKQRESLGWFVHMVRSVRRRFGRITLAFGDPLSLRETLGPPDPSAEPCPDEENVALQKIAFEVAVRINRATPITPTSLVTMALLSSRDRALTLAETRTLLLPLVEHVERRALPTSEPLDLRSDPGLRAALGALVDSGVVSGFDRGPEAVYSIGAEQHLTAAYYRNTIIHFFVGGAIAELALLRAAEAQTATESDAAPIDLRGSFWEEVMVLRDLLKFEFFFPDKEAYRGELASELAARDPDWEAALASTAEVRALVQRLQPLLAHVVLRPFLEAYQVVGDELESEQVVKSPDESAFLTACLARAQQYVLQRRILSRESVSRVLFQSALRLAANRGLLDPQATPEALRTCRSAFATEIRTAIRRIDAIDALAEARRAGVMG